MSFVIGEVDAIFTDKNGESIELVNGRIPVVLSDPTIPEDSTLFNVIAYDQVSGSSTEDEFFVYATGETLTVQVLNGGAGTGKAIGGGQSGGGSRVEIYYAPNGNTTGLVFISVLFVDGNTASLPITYVTPEVGNGTRSILIRRIADGSGSRYIYGNVKGFTE